MPTSSTKDRQIRKLKRERTLSYRLLDAAIIQRNQAQLVAVGLEAELKKYITEYGQLTPPDPKPEVSSGVNKISQLLEEQTPRPLILDPENYPEDAKLV